MQILVRVMHSCGLAATTIEGFRVKYVKKTHLVGLIT